ncbi:putative DNA-binding protein [Alteribacter aurantiacus]|uniref:putative DNA-binding protein n=1 Tax=Alteribacter aurantiacus TaxID=254410 RepID=UPI00041FAFFD|nr:putative DNA-binding protein [Alteribacter aurantiacus]
MIEKTIRINYLYDFYQSLLTDKQNKYMRMYYLDDWSLGEISEHFEVSRQAVYDNIRRTEALLEEYEEKLSLFSRYQERSALIKELRELTEKSAEKEEILRVLHTLDKLE